MTVPYSFATATAAIPLSQLDSNFNTTITLGNTAIQLGNTVTTLNNMTLNNVSILSGNVTITNVSVTTANVTTLNVANAVITTANVTTLNATTGNVTFANITGENVTTSNVTTLTLTNNPTLSGGTANGVLYLNGSKVATSGSALTFDGTSKFELSINQNASTVVSASNTTSGTAAYAAYKLASDTVTWLYNFSSGYTTSGRFAAGTTLLDANGSGGLSLNAQNGVTTFLIQGSEQARLTSTGLGVGTSSPGAKLDVAGNANIKQFVSAGNGVTDGYLGYSWNRNLATGALFDNAKYAYDLLMEPGSNNLFLEIYAPGSIPVTGTALVVTPAGNLGLGVSPPTGSNQAGIFLSGTNNVFGGAGNGASFTSNVYNSSGTWKYATSSFATLYQQTSGQHVFYTAASGTATNNISWTQAMTLFASGGLSLGNTTDPGAGNVNISGNISLVTNGTSFQWTNSGNNVAINGASGVLAFYTGTSAYNERARIDTSGNLLVGATTAGNNGITLSNSTVSPTVGVVGSASTSGNYGFTMYSTGVSANRFLVDYAGTIFATNTTISAISDQRFKENVRDLDVGLDSVMALKPRTFDWKAGKGKDIKNDRGFIAQEFEQVFPDLVDQWADPAPEGEDPYKSVRQDLIPVLVKAIQELKAEVDSLKSQLKGA